MSQDIKKLSKNIIAECERQGSEYTEIRIARYSSAEIKYVNTHKDWIKEHDALEIHLSTWKNNAKGTSYTTSSSSMAINQLIQQALANSVASEDKIVHYPPSSEDPPKTITSEPLSKTLVRNIASLSARLDFLKAILGSIQKVDPAIKTELTYIDRVGQIHFENPIKYTVDRITDYIMELTTRYEYGVKSVVRTSQGCGNLQSTTINRTLGKKIGKRQAQRLLKSVIVTPPPNKRMNVIVDGKLAGKIIHELFHGITGDFVLHGSPWKEKVGKRIFSKNLTIYDDPTPQSSDDHDMEPSLIQFRYDMDGNPTHKTLCIEKGVLNSFITDTRTAHLLNCENTRNARQASLKTPIVPESTNLIVKTGDHTLKDLIKEAEIGILCQGYLHVAVDWGAKQIEIVPEIAYAFGDNTIQRKMALNVSIKHPLSDIFRSLKMIGNRAVNSTILCNKGGGIISGVQSPAMYFQRLRVLN